MTQPTVIFFGPDGGPPRPGRSANKIYLRTLLYATSKRGRIVECMYARLRRGETTQNFNIWVYGENSLARGSGMYVGENGVACNHHFLLPDDGTGYGFHAGDYQLEVFAKLAGGARYLKLYSVSLVLSERLALELDKPNSGLYFDWGPDSCRYHPHISDRPESKIPPELHELLLALRSTAPIANADMKKARGEKSRSKPSGEGTP